MKQILLLFFSILFAVLLNGQSMVEIRNPGKYYVNGEKQTMLEMNALMKKTDETRELWRQSKAPRSLGSLFGFVGGFGMGWTLSTAIFKSETPKTMEQMDFDRAMIVAGVGGMLVSLPFTITGNKRGEKAVRHYNAHIGAKDSEDSSYWKIGSGGQGLSLSYNF